MSDKQYLVFAGYADEGYYASDSLDNLIGEMTVENAYQAIKQHPDRAGIIAIIENGKVIERLKFFADTENTLDGTLTIGGFRLDESYCVYTENTFKPYNITVGALTIHVIEAYASENGHFTHFDFSINTQVAMYGYYLNVKDVVRTVIPIGTLFQDPTSIEQAIYTAVINSFTAHRDWVAKGSPTVMATGC